MNPERSGLQPLAGSLLQPGDGGQLCLRVPRFPRRKSLGLEGVCARASVQARPAVPLGVSRKGSFAFPGVSEA